MSGDEFAVPHDGGVYGHIPGADGEQFIHREPPSYERTLASMRENIARARATQPNLIAQQLHYGEHIADAIAEALPDVDPDLVARASLIVLSKVGGMIAFGYSPALVLNVHTIALAMHAGHLPRTTGGGS